MGHVPPRKGVGSRDEGRWCAKRDRAPYQHPRRTEPRPHRFLLRFFSTSGSPRLYLPARSRPTFYSNLLVLTCSLLCPLSSLARSTTLRLLAGVPRSHADRVRAGPGPGEWAPMFHSPRSQNEPPRRQLIFFKEATSASAG